MSEQFKRGMILDSFINAQLVKKYDTQFNFFFAKSTNDLLYNRIYTLETINFKDLLSFADSSEYLKRRYFFTNSQGYPEIPDRIQLLADFYVNAVILRYEYPLMVITNTQEVFLRRLRRIKKARVEEGSSDDTLSKSSEKYISISSGSFIKTVNSSELERKSEASGDVKLSRLSLFEEELQSHSVFDDPQDKEATTKGKLRPEAERISFERIEADHLFIDVDEFDREDVIAKYEKLMRREKDCSTTNKDTKKNSTGQSYNVDEKGKYCGESTANKPRKPIGSPIGSHIKMSPIVHGDYSYEQTMRNYTRPVYLKPAVHKPISKERESVESRNKAEIDRREDFLVQKKQTFVSAHTPIHTPMQNTKTQRALELRYNSPVMGQKRGTREYIGEDRQRQLEPQRIKYDNYFQARPIEDILGESKNRKNTGLNSPYIFHKDVQAQINAYASLKPMHLRDCREKKSLDVQFQTESVRQHNDYDANKRRLIREKAAALLSRVKSQGLIRSGVRNTYKEY